MIQIGTIMLNDTAIVTDPCYERDGGIVVKNIVDGEYHVYTDSGERKGVLLAIHKDHDNFVDNSEDESPYSLLESLRNQHVYIYGCKYSSEKIDCVGVDSGQVCICDYDYFVAHESERDFYNTEGFYRKVCDITLSNLRCGVHENKLAVSESGWGDGSYDCYAIYCDDNHTVCGFLVDFGLYEEDDEDEWDDDEEWDEEDDDDDWE